MARLRWSGRAVVLAYRAAIALAGVVPPAVAYPALDRLADLVRLTAPGPRRAVDANLALVLRGRGRRHAWAARRVFRHALRNYYDTFRLPALSDEAVRGSVVIEGLEHLRDALAPGHGAILVSAHVSSVAFAVQALALAMDGHPGTVVVEAVEPPELLDLLLRARSSHGWRYRALGPGLTGELTAALRRNEVVCLVADRDIGGGGMVLDFFGRPASLPIGPALLSLRTGAPILSAAVSRRLDGRLNGQIGAPMLVGRTGNWRGDVAGLTSRVIADLEYHIGRFPEQWTVLQAIWGPDGR